MPADIPDLDQRRRAVFTPDNAFVWASAGTGKTHTLTMRALYLLLSTGGREFFACKSSSRLSGMARNVVRSLVLTTFTRKAAAEMQIRLYEYLDVVVGSSHLKDLQGSKIGQMDPIFMEMVLRVLESYCSGSLENLRRGARALSDLAGEFQIATFHSFAASLLRRYPLQAGIAPTAQIAREDEDDLAGIETLVVERWWKARVLRETDLQAKLASALELCSMRDLKRLLNSVYKYPWLSSEMDRFNAANSEETSELASAFLELGERASSEKGHLAAASRKLLDFASRLRDQDQRIWREINTFCSEYRSICFASHAKTLAARSCLKDLSKASSKWFKSPELLLNLSGRGWLNQQMKSWTSLRQFLQEFADWSIQAPTRELDLVTFDDVIRLTVSLLTENQSIARQERCRLKHLLVDEFQDTDPLQLQLIQALTDANDEEEKVLSFFVGDLKQSIYRFRGANVEAIKAFEASFLKGNDACRLHLTTSFRSLPEITGFANFVFADRLELVGREELLYSSRAGQTSSVPEWIRIEDRDGNPFKSKEARRVEAERIVYLIQDYLKLPETSYRDVLILCRKHADLDSLLEVLHRAGIPVISTGAQTFYRQQEVMDVLNLLIALYHPLDSLATAAVLRSPVVFLSDDEIHRLLLGLPAMHVFHSQKPLPQWLELGPREQIHRLRELASSRISEDLAPWLREVYRLVPKGAYSSSQDHEGKSWARIDQIFQRFREEAVRAIRPPVVWLCHQRARAARADLRDAELGEDVNLTDESVDAVRAMTVHKAKGLESDYVIVHGWERALSSQNHRSPPIVETNAPDDPSPVRAFRLRLGPVKLCSRNYREALEAENVQETAEALRLAYVAATRSRKKLTLVTARRSDTSIPSRLQELLSDRVAMQQRTEFRVLYEKGMDGTPAVQTSAGVQWNWDAHREIWEKRYALSREAEPLLFSPSLASGDSRVAAARASSGWQRRWVGQLAHAWLERWTKQKPCFEDLERLRLELGIEGGPPVSQQTEEVLAYFFDGKLPPGPTESYFQRLHKGDILGTEIPFFLKCEGQLWNGVVDLVFEERDGIIAVDFKARPQPTVMPVGYATQKDVYVRALSQLFPHRTVIFEFWWLYAYETHDQALLPFAGRIPSVRKRGAGPRRLTGQSESIE